MERWQRENEGISIFPNWAGKQKVCQSHFCKLGTAFAWCAEANRGRVGGDLKIAYA